MGKSVFVHIEAQVATVTLNRPEVFNAFDETMIAAIDAAFAQLEANTAVRVIVLAGEGKHFCAGADVAWMQRASEGSLEWNEADALAFAHMLARIDRCPKPTLARVHGAALGGGVGLVCACDFAIAEKGASFAVSEAKFGILPAVIGPYVMNAIGPRQARRLALTAACIGADEALQMGLVQHLVAPAELDAAVASACAQLLACSPNAQREINALFGQLSIGPVTDDVVALTARTIARVRGSAEAREGFAAFLGKRQPKWP